jgi:MFS family permease
MFGFMFGEIINSVATTQALLQLICRDRGISQAMCKKPHQPHAVWLDIVADGTTWSQYILAGKFAPGVILTFSGGFASDVFGRGKMMALPVLCELAFGVLMALAQRYGWQMSALPYFSVVCGLGGGTCFFLCLIFAAMADVTHQQQRDPGRHDATLEEADPGAAKHKKFNILEGAISVASVCAPLASSASIDAWGYQSPFVLGACSLLGTACMLPLIPRGGGADTKGRRPPATWKAALPWRVIRRTCRGKGILVLVLAMVSLTFYAWLYSFILWLVARFGATPDEIGSQLAVGGSLRALANLLFGRFFNLKKATSAGHGGGATHTRGDGKPDAPVVAPHRSMKAVAQVTFVALAVWFAGLAFSASQWQVYAVGVAGGVGSVALPVLRALVSDTAPAEIQGEAMAAVGAVQGGMQLLAGTALLQLYKSTLALWSGAMFAASAVVALGAAALMQGFDEEKSRAGGGGGVGAGERHQHGGGGGASLGELAAGETATADNIMHQ